MKTSEFLVIFENGKKEYFYGFSFNEIIHNAIYWANTNGLNPNIQTIVGEYKTINNIQVDITYDYI